MEYGTDIKPAASSAAEIYDRVSAETLLPGERAIDKEQLRMQHLAELDPRTAYERSVAEQLIDIEWELIRHRRLRDCCYVAAYRRRATEHLRKPHKQFPELKGMKLPPTEEDILLARDLVSSDPKTRAEAEEDFENETNWDPQHILAMAAGHAPSADRHEAKIADLERRRRALRKDYAELTATRARDIEDAEIVE